MEDLFSAPTSSQELPQSQFPVPSQITPENLERMKQQARELAIAQYMTQQQVSEKKTYEISEPVQGNVVVNPFKQAKVVYVKRNLTVAELIVVFVLSIGAVTGTQWLWGFAFQNLPRIEIQVK
jgi:hypothetical protein